jgi:hypothetical protein
VNAELETDPFGEIYGCVVENILLNGNEALFEDITGNHLPGYTNVNVTALQATEKRVLSRLPRNLAEFFPNLAFLFWTLSELEFISSEDLRPFPNLAELGLYGNRFGSLDGNLFQHTPNLQLIDFTSTQLTSVGFGLLDNLKSLKIAGFLFNPCISLYATTPEAIEELKKLLIVQCPPTDIESTKVLPFECPQGCVERIEALEREVFAEKRKVFQLTESIEGLKSN